jgi:hypothetical protein
VLTRKAKGDLAELKVACDLIENGYAIAIPFGENCDFDLVASRDGSVERIQVKYATSRDGVVPVECRSRSLTNGKVLRTKHYTALTVDWIAVYDCTTDRCFYLPAHELGNGKSTLSLRLTPTKNGQSAGVRHAERYTSMS